MLHIASSHIPLMGNWWHLVMPVVSVPIQTHSLIFPPPRELCPLQGSQVSLLSACVSTPRFPLCPADQPPQTPFSARGTVGEPCVFSSWNQNVHVLFLCVISAFKDKAFLSLQGIDHFHHPWEHMAGSVPACPWRVPMLLESYTGQERQSPELRDASWATRLFLSCFVPLWF